eukprot:c28623_g1_i1 orf=517-2010(-)
MLWCVDCAEGMNMLKPVFCSFEGSLALVIGGESLPSPVGSGSSFLCQPQVSKSSHGSKHEGISVILWPSSLIADRPRSIFKPFFRHVNGGPTRRGSLRAGNWHCGGAVQPDSEISIPVMDAAPHGVEFAAQSLEARSSDLRIDKSAEQDLARRIMTRILFNDSNSALQGNRTSGELQECLATQNLDKSLQAEARNNQKKEWQATRPGPEENRSSNQFHSTARDNGGTETLLYLESIGVDVNSMVCKDFSTVTCEVGKVRRVVHFLEYLGLRRKEVGRVLNICPELLHSAVDRDLKQCTRFLLEEVGLQKKDMRTAILRCPRLLSRSVKDHLRPVLRYLQCLGFTEMGILVSKNPSLLTSGIGTKLAPKLRFLESLGLSHEEALNMVVRFPAIFNYSVEENLKPKYFYLINEIGGTLHDLKAFPHFFGFSLERRIRPRHQILLQRKISLSLPTMLKMTEKEFCTRFGKAIVSDSLRGLCHGTHEHGPVEHERLSLQIH